MESEDLTLQILKIIQTDIVGMRQEIRDNQMSNNMQFHEINHHLSGLHPGISDLRDRVHTVEKHIYRIENHLGIEA
jgi:hypothetical protein